jgi:hypothetical protein
MSSKNRTISKVLTASNSDVYQVPLNYEAEVTSIFVANENSSAVEFSLDWYDSENSVHYTLSELVKMPPHSILQVTDGLWLKKSDKLRGLASATSSITITIQVREYFIPQQKT